MLRVRSWLGPLLASLLLFGGCKKSASREECEVVADRTVEFLKANPDRKPDTDYEPFRTSLVKACQSNGTTSKTARCIAAASTSAEAVACQLKN